MQRRHAIDECVSGRFAALAFVFCDQRHKRLGKCAFCEQPPHHVRELKRDLERVVDRARAKYFSHDHLIGQPRDAGQRGHGGDADDGFEQIQWSGCGF